MTQDFLLNSDDPIYALILCGGRSSRMGQDKGLLQLQYHEKKFFSFERAHQILEPHFEKIFLSLRREQWQNYKNFISRSQVIFDDQVRLSHVQGPLLGILSAQQKFPQVHWFILACDMLAFDKKILLKCKQEFYRQKKSTAFFYTDEAGKKQIEPFAAILHAQKLSQIQTHMKKNQIADKKIYALQNHYKGNFHFIKINAQEKKYFLNCNFPHEVKQKP